MYFVIRTVCEDDPTRSTRTHFHEFNSEHDLKIFLTSKPAGTVRVFQGDEMSYELGLTLTKKKKDIPIPRANGVPY